jgi:hypothetical protein
MISGERFFPISLILAVTSGGVADIWAITEVAEKTTQMNKKKNARLCMFGLLFYDGFLFQLTS